MPLSVQSNPYRPVSAPGRPGTLAAVSPARAVEREDQDVKQLQARRQSIQDQLLLLRGGTDGADLSQGTREVLEEKLQQTSQALRSAQAQAASGVRAAPARERERFDRYEPGPRAQASPGVYSVRPDGAGGYQVAFSPYSGGEEVPEAAPEDAPEGARDGDGRKARSETCTVNTDKVDAELRRLKQERVELQRQADRAEGPEGERLRRRLDALTDELDRKDNDAYRRQHAAVTFGA